MFQSSPGSSLTGAVGSADTHTGWLGQYYHQNQDDTECRTTQPSISRENDLQLLIPGLIWLPCFTQKSEIML